MSAAAVPAGPTLRIRGTVYPVLLPRPTDSRLHLAAVITSLQVLGQVAFDFRLSIAQILLSLATCALLEVGIALRRQRVLLWPASALLTGNGVAFILRVPGTEHGDWWSLHGWWIYVATAAVSLLSKHLIRSRGGHVFNPSNLGLVLCFLALGRGRAEPLDFWWGPMSPWLGLAFAIIVAGGLAILSRLALLGVAVGFWLSFAAGLGVVAATGHAMTARWHLGPIAGFDFWSVLVTSPEVLVFCFFMITDPKTAPGGRAARLGYAVAVGLLAAILIAPLETEFASKVALLGALAIVCAARPLLGLVPAARLRVGGRRAAFAGAAALAVYAAALVGAGVPARPGAATAAPLADTGRLPAVAILPSRGVDTRLDRRTAAAIASGLVTGLRGRTRSELRAAHGREVAVAASRVDRMRVWLEPGQGQGPPVAVARVAGVRQVTTYTGMPPRVVRRGSAAPFADTLRLRTDGRRWSLLTLPAAPKASTPVRGPALRGFRLQDVAPQVGVDFRQGSFRWGVTNDEPAMMGGGLCWLDYDGDGWLDLFVVNSYADDELPRWLDRGAIPSSRLFRNVRGRFVDVTARSHAGLQVRGEGCVAGDLDGDGRPDLYITTATDDLLLWNDGDGTFTEGARRAGVVSFGWHAGAAIADVNGDGRADLFVAGYADVHHRDPTSTEGFPGSYEGVRDLLFLNEGRRRFREVGKRVGLDRKPYDHSLGAVFSDLNGDGRLDLYVANDEDPNRLYANEPGGPLGFRLIDVARKLRVADANAGMGVAVADWSGDGRPDLLVSNSRGQRHAAYRSDGRGRFADARPELERAFGTTFTGWGDSWVDLDDDGRLDLVLANGAIPVRSLARDAGPIQVLAQRDDGFADARVLRGLRANGRGLAAADYDNDGRVDLAVSSIGGRLLLLRNTGATGHWLEVALPRFAPGTRVTAVLPDGRRLVREVQAGGSYLSSEDPRVHFGLGAATRLRELRVRYPDGTVARLRDVAADRIVTVPT